MPPAMDRSEVVWHHLPEGGEGNLIILLHIWAVLGSMVCCTNPQGFGHHVLGICGIGSGAINDFAHITAVCTFGCCCRC